MKELFKILAIIVGTIAVVIVSLYIYVWIRLIIFFESDEDWIINEHFDKINYTDNG